MYTTSGLFSWKLCQGNVQSITDHTGEYSLVDWAKRLNKDKIYQFMDSHIEGQYSSHEAMKVANIAIQCVNVRPQSRPKMDDVVTLLEQLQDSNDAVVQNMI
jgi:hypothetical protein